jgi:hypothetical protein
VPTQPLGVPWELWSFNGIQNSNEKCQGAKARDLFGGRIVSLPKFSKICTCQWRFDYQPVKFADFMVQVVVAHGKKQIIPS